ncbi:MAG: hypothetical protein ACRC92_26090 [Peptostreptococcaceae bacterium]
MKQIKESLITKGIKESNLKLSKGEPLKSNDASIIHFARHNIMALGIGGFATLFNNPYGKIKVTSSRCVTRDIEDYLTKTTNKSVTQMDFRMIDYKFPLIPEGKALSEVIPDLSVRLMIYAPTKSITGISLASSGKLITDGAAWMASLAVINLSTPLLVSAIMAAPNMAVVSGIAVGGYTVLSMGSYFGFYKNGHILLVKGLLKALVNTKPEGATNMLISSHTLMYNAARDAIKDGTITNRYEYLDGGKILKIYL